MTTHHASTRICMKSALMRVTNKVKNITNHIHFLLYLQCLLNMLFCLFLNSLKSFCRFPTGSRLLMVVAHDRDQRGTPNSTFHYEIKSVSPNPPDTEFFIDESGTISFKGCFDHEARVPFVNVSESREITVLYTLYCRSNYGSVSCSARSSPD